MIGNCLTRAEWLDARHERTGLAGLLNEDEDFAVFVAKVAYGEVNHRLGTVGPELFHPVEQFVALVTFDELRLRAVHQEDEHAITAKQPTSLLRLQLLTAHVTRHTARVGPLAIPEQPRVFAVHEVITSH